MFFDASQTQQATWETHPEPQADPVQELIGFGAAFLLGRWAGKKIPGK